MAQGPDRLYCTSCGEELATEDGFCGSCGHENPGLAEQVKRSSRPFRRRLLLVVSVALGLVVFVGVGTLLLNLLGEDQTAAGAEFDDGAEPVREYLLAEGSALVDFQAVTEELPIIEEDDADRCWSLISEISAEFGDTPEMLFVLAAATPDETTAHLLVNDIAAKRDLLASCAAGDGEDAAGFRLEVENSHQLVAARLAEAGVGVRR